MEDFYNSSLIQSIKDKIKTNNNKDITGNILQEELLKIVSALDLGGMFLGFASKSTNPVNEGKSRANGFYFSTEEGTYTNFIGSNNQSLVIGSDLEIIYREVNNDTLTWNHRSIASQFSVSGEEDNFASFDGNGGLQDSGYKADDFATAAQGALADTALQPTDVKTINNQSIVGSGNITIEGGGTNDYTDLENKPQINSFVLSGNKSASDLGLATAAQGTKADTAVQQVTVGTTTTGEAGTNASVTNSGTQTAPILNFTIPRGENGKDGQNAVNPFKGMYITASDTNIPSSGQAGDYIFIADANPATTIDLYFWNTEKTPSAGWDDTGYDINPGSLAEFAGGTAVSMVHIVNDFTTGGATDVASAETAKNLNEKVVELQDELLGTIGTIEVPYSDFTLGYYNAISATPGYSGIFVSSATNKSVVIEMPLQLKGKHISTTNNVYQYGFCKEYVSGNDGYVVYCDGCDRVGSVTKIDNVIVPEDCKYLYLYIGQDTNGVTITNNDSGGQSVPGIREEVATAKNQASAALEKSDEIEQTLYPILPRLEGFTYAYSFNGVDERATLKTPITLQSNGDSIEFTVDDVDEDVDSGNRIYTFISGSTEDYVAIGISTTKIAIRSDYIPVPNQGQSWILRATEVTGHTTIGKTFKVSFENGNIVTYVNGSPTWTYTGQLPLVIGGFGYSGAAGSTANKYWHGKISNVKVNGETYIISQKSQTSNVPETAIGTILSPKEQEAIDNSTPVMMFEKSANEVDIYIKTSAGSYVGIPFKHRQISWSENTYPAFLDNWGIDVLKEYNYTSGAMVEAHRLFQSGEAELAVQVPKGTGEPTMSYTGGAAHGFDNIVVDDGVRNILLLLNGQQIGETDVVSLKAADKFEVFEKSLIYQAYTNTNPWGEVSKHWLFTKDGVAITSSVKILRNIDIGAAQFGMLCVLRHLDGSVSEDYLTSKAVRDNEQYTIFEIKDGWWNNTTLQIGKTDHDCKKISLWGECNYGFSIEIETETLQTHGGMFIGTNNGQSYNKVYFDMVGGYIADWYYHAQQNDVLSATQKWYFNKNK